MLPNFISLHMICSKTEIPQIGQLAIQAHNCVWVGTEMLIKVYRIKCQTHCDLVILNTMEVNKTESKLAYAIGAVHLATWLSICFGSWRLWFWSQC